MVASAAARAVPLGQRDTARVLWRLRATLDACAQTALAARLPSDLHAQAFAAEIDLMRHRRMDGRLFAS
jgi:urease accessory protein